MPSQENILVSFGETCQHLDDIPNAYQSSLINDAVVNYFHNEDHFMLSQNFFDKHLDCCYVKVDACSPVEVELRMRVRAILLVAVFEGDIALADKCCRQIELEGGHYCFVEMGVGVKWIELNARSSAFILLRLHDNFASHLFIHHDWSIIQKGRLKPSHFMRFSEFKANEFYDEIWRVKREIIFLDMVFSSWEQSKPGDVSCVCEKYHPAYDKMMEVRAYVINNIESKLTVSGISRNFGMSMHQLRHCYLQVFGRSLPSFIKEVRMNEAKKLLCHSNKSIIEIAWDLGFDSLSGFSRSFYKYFKSTPEDVRYAIE